MSKRFLFLLLGSVISCALLVGCGDRGSKTPSGGGQPTSGGPTFSILWGSENEALKPLLDEFARQEGVNITTKAMGSVDIMLELRKGDGIGYDAVWPADRMWVTMGDKAHKVKNLESIARSPVVVGVKKSVAEKLGWVGKPVGVKDILAAAKSGRTRFMMTSASQSNSGTAAYFGFLYAFAGNPDVLEMKHLQDPAVQKSSREILSLLNTKSASSGWLKDAYLQQYDFYDAMVNYEAMIIEANRDLQRKGLEPLYAVYPVDGLAIADSPLGYVDQGNASKQAIFQKLQAYLLSPETQRKLLVLGRRTGLGLNVGQVDETVFNPKLGIDVNRVLSPINMPQADVIEEAIMLYQSALRKPSLTVFCLDYSGSMASNGGEEQLKSGMRLLLNQELARKHFLQAAPEDITIVIPFTDTVTPGDVRVVKGNNPGELDDLWAWLNSKRAEGGTNLYLPVQLALEKVKELGQERYSTAIILMTDGESNSGSFSEVQNAYEQLGLRGVPVHAIMFGRDASEKQLNEIAKYTNGRVFNGTKDLPGTLRVAKGYNN